MNRTQRILLAYNEFMRHYQQFGEEEKDLMAFFGLTPLLEIGFWSGLIDGEQAVNRKLLSDIDVGAYNIIFVMPKLRELLTRETDKNELIIADSQGTEREIKRVRLLIAEKERSLTDPQIVINVIRSMDELYSALSALHVDGGVSLAIGSIDSGSAKSFDFFGASDIMEDIGTLLTNVWDRIKYTTEDNFRHQIEVAMMAAGFVTRIKEAQAQQILPEEQGQRMTRSVAKSIETLFRSGAYTEEMDSPREIRASQVLTPRTHMIEYKHEERAEAKRDDMRPSLESAAASPIAKASEMPMAKASEILRDLKDQLEIKEPVEILIGRARLCPPTRPTIFCCHGRALTRPCKLLMRLSFIELGSRTCPRT